MFLYTQAIFVWAVFFKTWSRKQIVYLIYFLFLFYNGKNNNNRKISYLLLSIIFLKTERVAFECMETQDPLNSDRGFRLNYRLYFFRLNYKLYCLLKTTVLDKSPGPVRPHEEERSSSPELGCVWRYHMVLSLFMLELRSVELSRAG